MDLLVRAWACASKLCLFGVPGEAGILGCHFLGYGGRVLVVGELYVEVCWGDGVFVDLYFDVTEEYQDWLVEHKKEDSAYKLVDGAVMGRLANACWFTNLDHGKRHEPLLLDTMENNLRFNKTLSRHFTTKYGKNEYPQYDNY